MHEANTNARNDLGYLDNPRFGIIINYLRIHLRRSSTLKAHSFHMPRGKISVYLHILAGSPWS